MKRRAHFALAAALGALLVLPGTAFAELGSGHKGSDTKPKTNQEEMSGRSIGAGLNVRHDNGISYVSGGVDDAEQQALRKASHQFNLQLTLANKAGDYLGGADIRINNQAGKTVLATQSDGPLFLAKLPPGKYKLHATAEGKTLARETKVEQHGQRQIVMTWPTTGTRAAER
jgi:hypothetical protein